MRPRKCYFVVYFPTKPTDILTGEASNNDFVALVVALETIAMLFMGTMPYMKGM